MAAKLRIFFPSSQKIWIFMCEISHFYIVKTRFFKIRVQRIVEKKQNSGLDVKFNDK